MLRCYLIPLRTTKINKITDYKCWRGYSGKVTFIRLWWDCKLGEPQWKSVWRADKKL